MLGYRSRFAGVGLAIIAISVCGLQAAVASDSATLRKTAEKQQTGVEIALSGGVRPGAVREAAVPDLLSQEDVARYQEIFLVQRNGDWSRADQLIAGLRNDVLLGHVLNGMPNTLLITADKIPVEIPRAEALAGALCRSAGGRPDLQAGDAPQTGR